MPNFNNLKPEYSHLWATCKDNAGKQKQFEAAATLIKQGEDRYKSLEGKTGVPWYLIGMLHYREGDCNFGTNLANGDSLRFRTVHIPRGRPPVGNPPFTFEYAAIDALKYEGFDKISDWSIERVLYCMEQYNGWGYRIRGYPSAYVWAGTNNYHSGKFVADDVFSASVVDQQLGCAGIFKVLLDEHIDEPDMPLPADTTSQSETYKAGGVAADLNADSRKWGLSNIQQQAATTVGGVAVAGQAMKSIDLQSTKVFMDFMKGFILEYGLLIVVGTCVAVFGVSWLMKKYMVQDITSGRAIPSGQAIPPQVTANG